MSAPKPPGGLNTPALIASTLRRWGADLREEADGNESARVARFVGIKLDGAADAVELLDAAPRATVVPDEKQVARLRGKVYAALLDEKPIRTLFGRRWLDAPEAERLAAVAVAAILGAA